MDSLAFARALHVLAVVIWIGGVAMVTTIILPALRRGELGNDRQRAFEAVERRFAWHARLMVLLAGASGLYMMMRLDLWSRFETLHYWWMHAMVGVWSLFALMLFIVEPFGLRNRPPSSQRCRLGDHLRPPLSCSPRAAWARVAHSHGRRRGKPRLDAVRRKCRHVRTCANSNASRRLPSWL